MRKFLAILILTAVLFTQFGLAQASVCLEFMHRDTGPSHCEKAQPKKSSHCSGGAACAEMCRMAEEELPATQEKSGGDSLSSGLSKSIQTQTFTAPEQQLFFSLFELRDRNSISPQPSGEIILLIRSLLI